MMQYVLDLTDYACPLPLFMTKNAMKGLKQGDSLVVLLNKQTHLTDFELLAKTEHWQYESITQADETRLVFMVLGEDL